MKKYIIIGIIAVVLIGGIYFVVQKLIATFGIAGEIKTNENGVQYKELKGIPSGIKINFEVGDSCEKPGKGQAIKFSISGLKKASVKQFEYAFSYVDENKGSLQGNGVTIPFEVKSDDYKPMTPNCNELGLFSCSAGGKCVYYKVSEIEGKYTFYFENGEVGVWKEKYKT